MRQLLSFFAATSFVVLPVNAHSQKVAYEEGWDAGYSYFNTEIAILRASHIGNVDDLIRSINSGEPTIIRPFTYDLQNPFQY